ncbi:hypothetical protein HU200_054109 [Digitaria exilis]|uniref:Leucine-rich repeat-containing N-terminal plant-type domain-containing protein n=1 Tax=Digitaria exilis TaxID=1010633 RepID=A0A835AQY7_9POAL|nr:hypothetical protein HU200_054109 [Digitaria exilis]
MDGLLAFKQGINSDPNGILASWRSDGHGHEEECCRWRGVRCNNRTGHVVELRLEGSSGRIPDFLGPFKNLKYLNLSGIPFTGRVPPQLGNQSKLQYLDISGTQSTFSLDLSWLTRLQFLQYLNLQAVNLSMIANWLHVVNMIPSLKFIDLSDCLLPSASEHHWSSNLTSLEWLDLSENYFDHQIASCWFWNLTSLKYINLGFTGMYGQLPPTLGSMISLQFLDLSYSTLSLPMISLNNICSLRILNLETSFLYGNITELIERLPRCSPCKLQELHLQLNNLTGVLPNSMGHLTSLVVLDLSGNNITGDVPYEIGVLTDLAYLDLGYNSFDGVITEKHFGFLNNLQFIYLSYNSLKIELSSEWQPPFRLQHAEFANCKLGPSFPVWLRWMVGIYYLDISDTGINDRIPLGRNQIFGDLPRDMEMMSVERLYLNSNNLTGRIPPLPQTLTNLDISVNSLLGPLPLNFGAPKLTELSLFSNRISGHIPKYICKCKELAILDLANNLFEGKLPPCNGMTMLTTLELSNNSLSGELPTFCNTQQTCNSLI